ncbi:DUF1850 domain-containing protein [Virgibacillus sediminis]|uniref:DUF1850 domain-containing protein n=1 Tax=Virgibacillus sediminis TaxID=202260 RepID=A0ABV7A7P7_9BACI
MNSKWMKWGAWLIVPFFFLFFKLPVIGLEADNTVYYLKEPAFQLKWIHSVEKEEWFETYERHGSKLMLTDTLFKTFGAGTPSDGEVIRNQDGFVHMKVERKMDEVNLAVSKDAETRLETKEAVIPLYELVDHHENLRISVHYLHVWEYLGGKFL